VAVYQEVLSSIYLVSYVFVSVVLVSRCKLQTLIGEVLLFLVVLINIDAQKKIFA
jgi:hypothetical protein